MSAVRPIPEGKEGAVPYLCVRGGSEAIDFYVRAFGAVESFRMEHEGKIGHAELKIGPAVIFLADEYAEMGWLSPQAIGGTPVMMHLYVEDVDAFAQKAVAGGAKLIRPVEDQFYGDRGGRLEDPFGHRWHVATQIEELTPEEMRRRAQEKFGGSS